MTVFCEHHQRHTTSSTTTSATGDERTCMDAFVEWVLLLATEATDHASSRLAYIRAKKNEQICPGFHKYFYWKLATCSEIKKRFIELLSFKTEECFWQAHAAILLINCDESRASMRAIRRDQEIVGAGLRMMATLTTDTPEDALRPFSSDLPLGITPYFVIVTFIFDLMGSSGSAISIVMLKNSFLDYGEEKVTAKDEVQLSELDGFWTTVVHIIFMFVEVAGRETSMDEDESDDEYATESDDSSTTDPCASHRAAARATNTTPDNSIALNIALLGIRWIRLFETRSLVGSGGFAGDAVALAKDLLEQQIEIAASRNIFNLKLTSRMASLDLQSPRGENQIIEPRAKSMSVVKFAGPSRMSRPPIVDATSGTTTASNEYSTPSPRVLPQA